MKYFFSRKHDIMHIVNLHDKRRSSDSENSLNRENLHDERNTFISEKLSGTINRANLPDERNIFFRKKNKTKRTRHHA